MLEWNNKNYYSTHIAITRRIKDRTNMHMYNSELLAQGCKGTDSRKNTWQCTNANQDYS